MKNFKWHIVGQENILKYLETLILSSNIPHCFLFYGKPGLGKYQTALDFIKILQCYNENSLKNSFPCDNCKFCKNYKSDIIFIEKDNVKKNISIEEVRKMRSQLQKGSFLGGFNCAIIKNIEYLSESAYNSLLKILEEPPKNTIICLTSDSKQIPVTIKSRCQLLFFQPVPYIKIKNVLLNKQISEYKANIISKISNGALQTALDLTQEKNFQEHIQKGEYLLKQFHFKAYQRLKFFEKDLDNMTHIQQSQYLNELLNIWLILLKDIILFKKNLKQGVVYIDLLEENYDYIKNLNIKYLIKLLKLINNYKNLLNKNVNPKLVLENILLAF